MATTPQSAHRRRKKTLDLVDRLLKAIRREEWSVGDQLPPVRELVERYDVSLHVAQSAIQALAERNIVELVPRRGAFVSQCPAPSLASRRRIGVVQWYASREDATQVASEHNDASGMDRFPTDPSGWWGEVFWSLQSQLNEWDYQLLALPVYRDQPEPVDELIARCESSFDEVAGVIATGNASVRPLMAYLDQRELPWITINPLLPRMHWNFVASDHIFGGMQAGYAMAKLNKRHVLVLGPPPARLVSTEERMLGLFQGYLRAQRPTEAIRLLPASRGGTEKEGYELVAEYLRTHDHECPVDAIVAWTDWLAFGAMAACRDAGLAVPDQVSVIGCTGLSVAKTHRPSLAVLAQPMGQIGSQAAIQLQKMVQSGRQRILGLRVPSRLIPADSLPISNELQEELDEQFAAHLDEIEEINEWSSSMEADAVALPYEQAASLP